MPTKIQFRRGTATQWTNANPVLAEGEMGIELDTSRFKLGDGAAAWNALSYGGLQGPPAQKYFTFNLPGTTSGPYQGTTRFYPPFNCTLNYIRANVSSVPTDLAVPIQVQKNGSAIGTAIVQINAYTSSNVVINSSLTTSDYLSMYISGGTATNLIVTVGYY